MENTNNTEYSASMQLIETFAEFGPVYTKWIGSIAKNSGVTAARHQLLCYLRNEGAKKMSEIGKKLNVSPTNITLLVDGLEKDGFVERLADSNDRRAIYIRMTKKAETEILFDMNTVLKPALETFERTFTEKEMEQLCILLRKILSQIDYSQS